jgi:hypothetical protein
MDIQSELQRLRPQNPRWTAVEEACVKKCLELKSIPFHMLEHKNIKMSVVCIGIAAAQQALQSTFDESDDDEGESGFCAVLLMR